MTPHEFPGCNVNAAPPPGFEEMISPLVGFHNGRTWVTAWLPSPEDLEKLNAGEPIFVSVMSGSRRDVEGNFRPNIIPMFVGTEADAREVVRDTGADW